ncbi:AraC family transcriptional regulator [Gracilibacillus kekensis]|uniref:Transcriptional regulator, AraC family n=1 Tax=Gracilibacillus kekensis TaxID=1027249 RepID=A0A1M7QTR5_9BACI|nr:AraC family transcriptional regulator [Gracilibacillus kekensis]SHN35007.1 transcriptional regulator, AraC family [Gracilibacillus kekensis]
MTIFPKYLSEFPNQQSSFPFHLSIHEIQSYFPSHRHDFLEFSFVIEGRGTETINGKKHDMKPGTFTLILPYQIHEIHAEPDQPLKLYNCIFGMDLLFESNVKNFALNGLLFDYSDERALVPFVQLDGELLRGINIILEEMLAEYHGEKPWKEIMIKLKLLEILVIFERTRQHSVSVFDRNEGAVKKNTIWPIVHYVHTHYQENITLTEIARQFFVSAPYLSELFKQQIGQNFIAFLHEVRIRHACSLLNSTDLSIANIAMEVGYSSFKTFSRVFREFKKMTPTEYRRIYKEN